MSAATKRKELTNMHSLTSFLLATILALAIVPVPQIQKKSQPEEITECGTVVPPGQLEAELAGRTDLAGKSMAPMALAAPPDAPYYLPMTIHIVHRSNGTDGLPMEQLGVVMQTLNQMWRQVGIQFFIYGDIDHINDDNHFIVPNVDANQDALRNVRVVPNTINVYFANLMDICGQASFPKSSSQGVLLSNSCMNGISPSIFGLEVFAHEMGHYFDLLHTDETWKDSNGNPTRVECPSRDRCTTTGDLLCDTPADPGLFVPKESKVFRVDNNCVYDQSAPIPAGCDSTPYDPPTRNFMSLSRKQCRDQFTVGQIDRILNTLRNKDNRKNLINSGVRYVNPQASSSNSSCTYSSPCRTLAKAVSAAQWGDFIFLKPGNYQTSFLGGKQLSLNTWGNTGAVNLMP
jgi:hypothetical protein